MGLNWEKANKRDLIRDKGYVDSKQGLPKAYSKKKKKPYKFRAMKSKFNGNCVECRLSIKIGEDIKYYFGKKVATHQNCSLKGIE